MGQATPNLPNPTGLCQCGCGQLAPIATASCASRGWVKGKPFCFVKGHIGGLNATKAYLAKFGVDAKGRTTKLCTWCKLPRLTTEFDKSNHDPNRLRSNCHSCQNEQAKEHYRKNPEPGKVRARKARKKARVEVRARLARIKSFGCRACNEKDPCCIEFHHVFGKDRHVSHCESIPSLERELIRCALLCANCHKKAHAGRLVISSKMICTAQDGALEGRKKRRVRVAA